MVNAFSQKLLGLGLNSEGIPTFTGNLLVLLNINKIIIFILLFTIFEKVVDFKKA